MNDVNPIPKGCQQANVVGIQQHVAALCLPYLHPSVFMTLPLLQPFNVAPNAKMPNHQLGRNNPIYM